MPSKMTEWTTFEAVLQLPRIHASATITARVVAHAHNHLRSHSWRRLGNRPRRHHATHRMRGHRHNVIVGGTPEETSLRCASVPECHPNSALDKGHQQGELLLWDRPSAPGGVARRVARSPTGQTRPRASPA